MMIVRPPADSSAGMLRTEKSDARSAAASLISPSRRSNFSGEGTPISYDFSLSGASFDASGADDPFAAAAQRIPSAARITNSFFICMSPLSSNLADFRSADYILADILR